MLPIPFSFARIDEDTLREDLPYLAKNVCTIQSLRRKFGTRLLDLYTDKVSFDLQSILLEFDYLP